MVLLVYITGRYISKIVSKSLICLIKLTIFMSNFSTPLMAAMHEDDSPELTEVARILKDVLDVIESNINSLLVQSLAMTLVD